MPVSSPSSPNIDQPTQDPSCLRVGKVSDGTFSRWSPSTTGDDFIEVSALDEGAHSGPQWLLIIRGHGQRRRSIVRPSTPARSPMIPCAMFRLVSSLHPMDFVRGPRPDAMMRQRHHPRFLRLSANVAGHLRGTEEHRTCALGVSQNVILLEVFSRVAYLITLYILFFRLYSSIVFISDAGPQKILARLVARALRKESSFPVNDIFLRSKHVRRLTCDTWNASFISAEPPKESSIAKTSFGIA